MQIFDGPSPEREPLSRCDRLNAQLMRWRLRKHFPEAGLDEQARLMEMIAELGRIVPALGLPIPRAAESENLAASIAVSLQPHWESGKLTGFDESGLSFAVHNHIKEHYYSKQSADPIDLTPIPDEIPFDEDLLEWQDFYPGVYSRLDRDESYLFAWLLVVGKNAGAQSQAARAIDRSPKWAHDRWLRFVSKCILTAAHPTGATEPPEEAAGGEAGADRPDWAELQELLALAGPITRRELLEGFDRDEGYGFGWLLAFDRESDFEEAERRAVQSAGRSCQWFRAIGIRIGETARRVARKPS